MELILKEMERIYKEKFVESTIKANNACLGKDTKFINLYLARNEEDVANRIWANDMFNIILELVEIGEDNYRLEAVYKMIRINPIIEYCYCNYRNLSFRKVTGDREKILKTFKKFVDRLYDTLKEEYDNDNLLKEDKIKVEKIVFKRGN